MKEQMRRRDRAVQNSGFYDSDDEEFYDEYMDDDDDEYGGMGQAAYENSVNDAHLTAWAYIRACGIPLVLPAHHTLKGQTKVGGAAAAAKIISDVKGILAHCVPGARPGAGATPAAGKRRRDSGGGDGRVGLSHTPLSLCTGRVIRRGHVTNNDSHVCEGVSGLYQAAAAAAAVGCRTPL